MRDFNEPTQDPSNYKQGIFYFNSNDPRTIVPKMNQSLGFTLNFASMWSYILIVAVLTVSFWLF